MLEQKLFYIDKDIYDKGYVQDLLDLIKNKDLDDDYIKDFNEIIEKNDSQSELLLELFRGHSAIIQPVDFKKGSLGSEKIIELEKDVAYDIFKAKSKLLNENGPLSTYEEIKNELLDNLSDYQNACAYGIKDGEKLDMAILYGFKVKH